MSTFKRNHKLRLLLRSCGAICALAIVPAAACNEDPVPLFDEQGTWALVLFDIDGTGLVKFDISARLDQFLIHFDQESKIVAASGCIDSMNRTDITETLCDADMYQCRCFTYEFEETQMTWTEFTPKGGVKVEDPPKDSTAPKVGEPYSIAVEEYPDSNQTYRYSTLPYGLFNSDGETTKYVFQTRGDAVFEVTGCMDYCGIPAVMPTE
ncbi:MAG: hypothetical protein IPO88_25840 [Nannocystis sp.]|uniref:hypothetical protein n=1 Tax=Nannocystis sp. TaxID=1962667 RepID=UPI00242393F1|nr:hypothetical protein [Nannocystis sp.]MBK9756859.1 hypothetical protein [Nannocystis sp.]